MKRVLVVDDAAFMRLKLKTILEKIGFSVAGEAENGKVALQRYSELNPDIVTLDITMPEMDGLTALREIKRMDSQAVVVVVSAMGQEAYVKEAVLSGAKTFIVKPFTDESVKKIFSKLA